MTTWQIRERGTNKLVHEFITKLNIESHGSSIQHREGFAVNSFFIDHNKHYIWRKGDELPESVAKERIEAPNIVVNLNGNLELTAEDIKKLVGQINYAATRNSNRVGDQIDITLRDLTKQEAQDILSRYGDKVGN
jgi:hypothetical protein